MDCYFAGVFIEESASAFGVDGLVQCYFVIASDHHFVPELQLIEQSEEFVEMLLSAVSREVACADEDLAFNVLLDYLLELLDIRVGV